MPKLHLIEWRDFEPRGGCTVRRTATAFNSCVWIRAMAGKLWSLRRVQAMVRGFQESEQSHAP